ncbi:Cytochrome C' [Thiohalomonas denitrificans]|uniref:Cytochrome C n=2 Tax=Thiohalomonas denitrificans TaxID=415747 RepID=A0A1G5Q798_9GAMM|nr:Cytochrome C' [Thiohalomonas denitrificans]
MRKKTIIGGLIAGVLFIGGSSALVAAEPSVAQKMMQKQLQIMEPEMRKRIQKLSPETKKALLKIYSQHTRHSDNATLRHVMHEVLGDYQAVATGLMTDNPEQAAEAARRLANHRIPRGGLLPYMKLEDITDEKIGVLVPFNDDVEGNALRLADAAEKNDMAGAAEYFGKVTNGCMSCHQVFRGKPGVSQYLR